MNDIDNEEIEKITKLFERRDRIIRNNNSCIMEITLFYENFLLSNIIVPFFFNRNYNEYKEFNKYISERMNFMDRFKIVVDIAKSKGINTFKSFNSFIRTRNKIAHNCSCVVMYNRENNENEILFGGQKCNWEEYLMEIKKWADLSYGMAEYTMNVYKAINYSTSLVQFPYCKIEGNCVCTKCALLLLNPDGKLKNVFQSKIDSDLLQYMKEEYEIIKKGSNY